MTRALSLSLVTSTPTGVARALSITPAILLILLSTFNFQPVCASPETAWIIRTNFANPTRTNTVHSMQFDSAGNILVAGSAPSAAGGDLDYALIKYSQAGVVLWQATYNSAPGADDRLRGMALDPQGNVYVTGTSRTVKYNSNGLLQWVANYSGRSLAVSTNGSVVVVGFQTNDFSTVKLSADFGTNVWLRTFDYAGKADRAQAVEIGQAGEVWVAGTFEWVCDQLGCYVKFGLVKYDSAGGLLLSRIWEPPNSLHYGVYPEDSGVMRVILVPGGIYLLGNFFGGSSADFIAGRFDAAGNPVWSYDAGGSGSSGRSTAAALGRLEQLYMTGWGFGGMPARVVTRTYALSASGSYRWERTIDPLTQSYYKAGAIVLDADENAYILIQKSTNYFSPSFDFLTVKYDSYGNELWRKQYDSPTGGSDVGMAILSAPGGGLFVAGHSGNASGGNDFVLIKYVELQNIQWQGTNVLLQFCATNNQPCRFQGSTNLLDWQDLATVAPDPSGICRYTDTNAPAHPHRFYRTVTP